MSRRVDRRLVGFVVTPNQRDGRALPSPTVFAFGAAAPCDQNRSIAQARTNCWIRHEGYLLMIFTWHGCTTTSAQKVQIGAAVRLFDVVEI